MAMPLRLWCCQGLTVILWLVVEIVRITPYFWIIGKFKLLEFQLNVLSNLMLICVSRVKLIEGKGDWMVEAGGILLCQKQFLAEEVKRPDQTTAIQITQVYPH